MLGKKTLILVAAVAISMPALAAKPLPKVVATVNGENITSDQLLSKLVDWQAQLVIDEMVDARIVAQEAKKAGVVVTVAQVNAKLEDIKKNLPPNVTFEEMLKRNRMTYDHAVDYVRMQLQIDAIVTKSIKVPKEEIDEYLKVKHILIRVPFTQDPQPKEEKDKQAKEKIESIAQEIKNGLSFEEAAGKYSEDPGTKSKGGDLDWFSRGENSISRMDTAFEEAAYKLSMGQVSEPVKSAYGYHLIKLEKTGKLTTLAERRTLKEKITQARLGRTRNQWFNEVREKAKVKNILSPQKPAAAKTAPKPAAQQPGVQRPTQPAVKTPPPADNGSKPEAGKAPAAEEAGKTQPTGGTADEAEPEAPPPAPED